jgi:hypothetical protein
MEETNIEGATDHPSEEKGRTMMRHEKDIKVKGRGTASSTTS